MPELVTEVQHWLPWLPEVFLSQSDRKGEEKPLVQAVDFSEKAGPMGCRFISPESDFDPSNSIGQELVSSNEYNDWFTLIGSRAHCGHNRNAAKFRKAEKVQ